MGRSERVQGENKRMIGNKRKVPVLYYGRSIKVYVGATYGMVMQPFKCSE